MIKITFRYSNAGFQYFIVGFEISRERASCAKVLAAVFFSFMYSLSLNLMDLIIP